MLHDGRAIRRATVADAPSIACMHVESWLETYTGIVPGTVLATLSVSRRTAAWENILRDPIGHAASVVYVKETDDAIVGFGACSDQRDVDLRRRGFDGEIASIYVLQRFQSKGIGQALMRVLSSDLVDRGCTGAALWVLKENVRARHFYERCGGEVVGNKEDRRGEVVFSEVAYGWRNIKQLQDHMAQHH